MEPRNRYRQQLGKWGEDLAARFLEERGFRIITRNFRTRKGEIDLIVLKDTTLVFVEVKSRQTNLSGYPEEAVTDEKIERMHDVIEDYLNQYPEFFENWRVDVISIMGKPGIDAPDLEWFENVS